MNLLWIPFWCLVAELFNLAVRAALVRAKR